MIQATTTLTRAASDTAHGLSPDFPYMDNWCRSAVFYACNDNCDRAVVVTNIRRNWINRIMNLRINNHPGMCNRIKTLCFLGPTGGYTGNATTVDVSLLI